MRETTDPLQLVRKELRTGEHLFWADKADGKIFMLKVLPIAFFGLFFFGFAVFWTGMAYLGTSAAGDAGWFRLFPLFGVPFMMVGFAMVVSPIAARVAGNNTYYGLTEQRLITLRLRPKKSVKSVNLKDVRELELQENDDGTGTILFNRDTVTSKAIHQKMKNTGFYGIGDARQVEAEIARRRDEARRAD